VDAVFIAARIEESLDHDYVSRKVKKPNLSCFLACTSDDNSYGEKW
jgi:hypothetical protein